MTLVDVAAIVIGATGVTWLLVSVVRTIVMPRPERVWLTGTIFALAAGLAFRLARSTDDPVSRHRILGAFAPAVLVVLPVVWSIGVAVSFAAIYWGAAAGDLGAIAALELSGSSLTTLGFVSAESAGLRLLAILEALVGLGLVALMISFLPTLYSTFSRREVAVGRLTIRAGDPANPVDFVARLAAIARLDQVGERWDEWEDWFVELGETHTTFPALVFFRSARPGRNWLSAAELALDTGAIVASAHLAPHTGQADTMIRAGYLSLRSIADYYDVEPELDPALSDHISVPRQRFELLLDELERRGVELRTDRDDAWRHFSGWRVNYDRSLIGLRRVIGGAESHWDLIESR